MKVHKQLRAYIKSLVGEGWTVEQGKKALKLRSPEGRLVACSISPSCLMAIRNVKSDVNKIKKGIR